MLSLKGSFAIYQNVISHLSSNDEISFLLELDESEKEEKKELDESEKIQQKNNSTYTFSNFQTQTLNYHILLNYKVWHLEYTTPPPELG